MLALPGFLAFLMRGFTAARCGVWNRIALSARLIRVHLVVPCAHAPLALLSIVEEIVELPQTTAGAVVECGAYLGGSTAKLSHAAAISKRRLIVCDSFEGLPPVRPEDHVEAQEDFEQAAFSGGLATVRSNVERYGRIGVVQFVPGWFQESLSRLERERIACLWLDVDLQESIRTCLGVLWKQLEPGAKVFVHDVDRPPVVAPFQDLVFWRDVIGAAPPRFVGEGKGLGWQRRLLGYAVKPVNQHGIRPR